jgi:GDP-4-dehydro-6-deoxy-D-mannose reductase
MRLLIAGADGFVGRWLASAALSRGWTVVGTYLHEPPRPERGVPTMQGVQWVRMDLRDSTSVAEAVATAEPDLVAHLAALSHVPACAADPVQAYDINVLGYVRIATALAKRVGQWARPRVLVIGSGEQYGNHPEECIPLTEQVEQRPLNVYAATKAAQEIAALHSWRSGVADTVVARAFPASGPGQGRRFLLPSLVLRALALSRNGGELTIGNGGTVRDYLHVADVVSAYLILLERGAPGAAYNVCSGTGIQVSDAAARVLAALGCDAPIVSDPALRRTVDVPMLVGSNERLRALGWSPKHTFDEILRDLIGAAGPQPPGERIMEGVVMGDPRASSASGRHGRFMH